MVEYFVDGSTNEFGSAYCVIRENALDEKELIVLEKKVPIPEIEYLAVIHALKICIKDSIIYTDNKQVYLELNYLKSIPERNLKLVEKATELMVLKNCKIEKVHRKKNIAGLYLEKRLKKLNKSFGKILNPSEYLRKQIKKEKQRRRYVKHR